MRGLDVFFRRVLGSPVPTSDLRSHDSWGGGHVEKLNLVGG